MSANAELRAYAEGQRSILRMLRRHIDKGTCSKFTADVAMALVAEAIEASIIEVERAAGVKS